MKTIISRENASFKQWKKLAMSARARRQAGRIVLDGVHLLQAALTAGITPVSLLLAQGAEAHGEIAALLRLCPTVEAIQLSPALFAELSPVETPRGLIAVLDTPQFTPPTAPQFGLLLEDIQDPGNLGAILRTAAAAGVEVAWLSPGCADAWAPKVLRGGMGAHFVLPIVEGADLTHIARDFAGESLAACLSGKSLYQSNLTGAVAFIIGNEGAGLSEELIAAASQRFTIPMPGQIESLNAAAAAAICLFERARQTSLADSHQGLAPHPPTQQTERSNA